MGRTREGKDRWDIGLYRIALSCSLLFLTKVRLYHKEQQFSFQNVVNQVHVERINFEVIEF